MPATATKTEYYRDQQSWRDLQQFLPAAYRLDDSTAPQEEFWEWNGHRVHLDRYRNPDAKAKVILHHGVGTNGRQMSLILGAPLAAMGFETVALDDLGYGLTRMRPGFTQAYDDWVELTGAFVSAEKAADPRPTVLYGLSAGGMLTYHVAAAMPKGSLAGIVGMTFLDQRSQQVRDETAHDIVTARAGGPLMGALGKTPAGAVPYPMTLASKMSALANDPGAMKVFLADRTSAGNWVPVRFLDRYLHYAPAAEPEDFDACPVLLTQPAKDRWSPHHLSVPFLSRITKVPVTTVMLENAGHYPLEEPGLTQMREAIAEFTTKVAS